MIEPLSWHVLDSTSDYDAGSLEKILQYLNAHYGPVDAEIVAETISRLVGEGLMEERRHPSVPVEKILQKPLKYWFSMTDQSRALWRTELPKYRVPDVFRGEGEPPSNQDAYTIDGRACRDFATTITEFNRVFGPWWGNCYWNGNLDAFNDLIDWVNDFGPYVLVWVHSQTARQGLGHQAMSLWLIDHLRDVPPEACQDWREHLAQVERGEGKTLFDELVEIIADHEKIELRRE